jgi:hypothetical protein
LRMEKKEMGMDTVGSSNMSAGSRSYRSSSSSTASTAMATAPWTRAREGRRGRGERVEARIAVPAMRSRDARAGVFAERTVTTRGRVCVRIIISGEATQPCRCPWVPLRTSELTWVARTAAAGAATSIGALSEDRPAGRVRGSVRVAARLDLWRAGPIAEARSFPAYF